MEVIAFNGMSFSHNAHLISDEFDIHVIDKQLKKHMTEHLESATAARFAILMGEAGEEDGGGLTSRGMMQMLLADVQQRVASKEIRIGSIADLTSMVKIREEMCQTDPAQTAASGYTDQRAERDFFQLRLIMMALGDTLPPQYLVPALKKAVALGLDEDLVAIAMPIEEVVGPAAVEAGWGAARVSGPVDDSSSDADGGVMSSDVVTMLLADAQAEIVGGRLHARTCRDVARLVKCSADVRKMELAKRAATGRADRSTEDAFRNLGYIMAAFRDVVPPTLLIESIKRAWSLGLGREIASLADVPLYQSDPPYIEVDMSLAVADMDAIRRGARTKARTREEVEAFDRIEVLSEPEALARLGESETPPEPASAVSPERGNDALPELDNERPSEPGNEVPPEFNSDVPPEFEE